MVFGWRAKRILIIRFFRRKPKAGFEIDADSGLVSFGQVSSM
jgi:hypothetical protein